MDVACEFALCTKVSCLEAAEEPSSSSSWSSSRVMCVCVFLMGKSMFVMFLITKGSLSYLSSPCFSKNVLQSGVGIVH